MRLKDRVAIVTGGGHGLGRAYSLRLASEGAKIACADLDYPAAKRVAGEIVEQGGQAIAIAVDVANAEQTVAMAKAAADRFGRIDILINNAGMCLTYPISRVRIDELDPKEWERCLAVNLGGMFHSCRAVLPYMKQQSKGKIVNIGSSTVFDGPPTRIHYVSAKSGVIGFTRCLSHEVGEYNICVNTLVPGATDSAEGPDPRGQAAQERAVNRRAFKRVEKPADLTGTVAFLCSDDSDFITGQMIVVDGGGLHW